MCNNLKLDLVNMNAYIKFGEILSIVCQDTERKRKNYDERTDEWNDSQPKFYIAPPLFQLSGNEKIMMNEGTE